MKVTLRLFDGRQITFSEVENISVLKNNSASKSTEVVEGPTEGKWFKVNPLTINKKLFIQKRRDPAQEKTRKIILEALKKVKRNSRYSKPFETMIPKKTWERKTATSLKDVANDIGDHNADWVEQALEWAQRIANGETWETICNEPDIANCYRLVVWKKGLIRLIGGTCTCKVKFSPSDVGIVFYSEEAEYESTVPLVVRYCTTV